MRLMRFLAACTLVLAVGLIASRPATAQEDVMQLADPAFATHQRPGVTFDHATHSGTLDCLSCHHYYENGQNVWDGSQDSKCSSCHKVEGGENATLMNAYHRLCINCHTETLKRGEKVGGLMCGQCHARKQ
jgi:predicted CXXCH cytochrome family protein